MSLLRDIARNKRNGLCVEHAVRAAVLKHQISKLLRGRK